MELPFPADMTLHSNEPIDSPHTDDTQVTESDSFGVDWVLRQVKRQLKQIIAVALLAATSAIILSLYSIIKQSDANSTTVVSPGSPGNSSL